MGGKIFRYTAPTDDNVTYVPMNHDAPVPYYEPQLPRRRLDGIYSKIPDDYETLEQVTSALAKAGLESSNLIVGIDFTKSNEWTGKVSFNGQSLHKVGELQNPYEQAISIIGKTLSDFDEDNLIPCFGFGDASTHDDSVFSFYPDLSFCQGFEDVLKRYREIVPHIRLAGPTSFAPVIEVAIKIVEQSGGRYHVLLIIADGQVTRSVETEYRQLSSQERNTINAIVKASKYPLSIILVGVGDGPWDMMKKFDDNIPSRAFDNLQFVNFTDIMSKNMDAVRKEAEFALTALMEYHCNTKQHSSSVYSVPKKAMFRTRFPFLHLAVATRISGIRVFVIIIQMQHRLHLRLLVFTIRCVSCVLITRRPWFSIVGIRPVASVIVPDLLESERVVLNMMLWEEGDDVC